MDHIRQLAEIIGPRGSTTPEEKAAATYVHDHLAALNLTPRTESFRSARSAWLPAALFWSLILASGFIFLGGWRAGTIVALVLTASALGSILLELTFRPNPLRWILPKAESQNVWTRIDAIHSKAQHHVVLVAHLDTHRTPLVFSSNRWVRGFEKLVPLGMALTVVLLVLFALSLLRPMPWIRLAVLGPMLAALGMLILMLQADFTPYSHGANDNASGVGVALSMAAQLVRRPLKHTAVWIVLTGCEEVGCYGADAFLRRHKQELPGAAWITLDNVGSRRGTPVVLAKETFLKPVTSDPNLRAMTRRIAAERSDLELREIEMRGAYTEGAIGALHGLRVLTIESHQPDGTLSDWHRTTDTLQYVSSQCVEATEWLVSDLLRLLDEDTASV